MDGSFARKLQPLTEQAGFLALRSSRDAPSHMQTHTMANRAVLPDYSDRIARAFHPVPFSPACLACRCTCNVDMEFIHNIILAFPYSFVKRIYSLFCIIFKTFNLILSLYLS